MENKKKNSALLHSINKAITFIETYVWPIAVVFFVILLMIGYQFVISPQLKIYIDKREDIRIQQLEAEKQRIALEIQKVQNIIEQEKTISANDREKIDTLFVTLEENIILMKQLEAMFTNEYARVESIALGDIVSENTETSEEEAQSDNDLGGASFNIFDFIDRDTSEQDNSQNEVAAVTQIVLKKLPVSVTFVSPTYYDAKTMLTILENVLPITDVDEIAMTRNEDGTIVDLSLVINFENQRS